MHTNGLLKGALVSASWIENSDLAHVVILNNFTMEVHERTMSFTSEQ